MTIAQTVTIPTRPAAGKRRRLTINIPVREALQGIWAICENAPVTSGDFLAERSHENEREEAAFNRQSAASGSAG